MECSTPTKLNTDILVIGGSLGAYTASLYCSYAHRKFCVLEVPVNAPINLDRMVGVSGDVVGFTRDMCVKNDVKFFQGSEIGFEVVQNGFRVRAGSVEILCKSVISELVAAWTVQKGVFFCGVDDSLGGSEAVVVAARGCKAALDANGYLDEHF